MRNVVAAAIQAAASADDWRCATCEIVVLANVEKTLELQEISLPSTTSHQSSKVKGTSPRCTSTLATEFLDGSGGSISWAR